MTFQDQLDQFIAKRNMTYQPVSELPPMTTIDEYSFIGSWTITKMLSKTKIILEDIAFHVEDHLLTPSEMARIYLTFKFSERNKRMRASQADSIFRHRHPPLFAHAGDWGDCAYVDIASAYWSIMKIVGWDIDYKPFAWLRLGRGLDDFPYASHKMTRNCLLSNSLPTVLSVWNGQFFFRKHAYNPHLNLVLWAFVQDVLNGVACDMRKLGVYYVHTDGYIMDRGKVDTALSIIEDWGLRGTVKHVGDTVVHGLGSYEIGDYKTKKLLRSDARSINNISYDEWGWLRERLYRASCLNDVYTYMDIEWHGR